MVLWKAGHYEKTWGERGERGDKRTTAPTRTATNQCPRTSDGETTSSRRTVERRRVRWTKRSLKDPETLRVHNTPKKAKIIRGEPGKAS